MPANQALRNKFQFDTTDGSERAKNVLSQAGIVVENKVIRSAVEWRISVPSNAGYPYKRYGVTKGEIIDAIEFLVEEHDYEEERYELSVILEDGPEGYDLEGSD